MAQLLKDAEDLARPFTEKLLRWVGGGGAPHVGRQGEGPSPKNGSGFWLDLEGGGWCACMQLPTPAEDPAMWKAGVCLPSAARL